jgi:hypothetical protein
MPTVDNRARAAAACLVAMLALALSACMLSPGKFASTLDVRKDGRFSFTYAGEIHVLALSKLAEMGRNRDESGPFAPRSCFRDSGPDAAGKGASAQQRKCTAAEIDQQKSEWEQQRSSAADRKRRDAESMKAMFGGIDPADPRAAEELAVRLRRQAGWRRVTYRGDGLYDVDFAISGQLSHDFVFPVIERFPAANPFVQVMPRGDRSLRIDAPGFAPAAAGEPYRGWMQAAALSEGQQRAPRLPEIDGTFVLRTDAAIRANNTDEGPQADTTGQSLSWRITPRSAAAPMALLELAR